MHVQHNYFGIVYELSNRWDAKQWSGALWMICTCLIVVNATNFSNFVQCIMAHKIINQIFNGGLDTASTNF